VRRRRRGARHGPAALNPNGTIALGVSIVTPSGATAQISTTLDPATVSGSWADADGHSGVFAFNPPTIAGVPRPAPTTSGLVTSAQLAASIFAGTGGATAVARSDHLHDDRYYTKPQTDVVVAAAGAVVIHGPGFNVPNPLTVEATLTNLGETIVTPKAGRLSITKYVGGYTLCSVGSAHGLFLTVDGAPIRGSAAYNPSSSTMRVCWRASRSMSSRRDPRRERRRQVCRRSLARGRRPPALHELDHRRVAVA
jgi:hypothetical protein